MKKSDLKDGMIVELNYGKMGIILNNSIRYNLGFDRLNIYDDNLRFEDVTIDRIYEVTNDCCSIKEVLNKDNLTLMWKRPREIDWSKVPEWTKVQVRDCKNQKWRNRYFSRYNPYKETPYIVSAFDKFIFDDRPKFEGTIKSYRQCRIHPSVEIPKEWYKE